MKNIRSLLALCATAALVAVGHFALAEDDDLDSLLNDLEGAAEESVEAKPEAAEAAPAAEESVAEAASAAAEEPVAQEDPAAEAEAAEESAEPAAEAEAAEESAEPAAEAEAAEESAEPAAEAEAAEESAEPAAESAAPAGRNLMEKKVLEEAEDPAIEVEFVPADAAAEEPAAAAEPAEEASAEGSTDGDAEAAEVAETADEGEAAAQPAAKPAAGLSDADREILENARLTEVIRSQAYEEQALREMKAARDAAASGEYRESIKAYGRAAKLLKDNPRYRELHRECGLGIAEGFYQAAWQEKRIGRREKALQFMQIAFDRRHPLAHDTIVAWKHEDDPDAYTTDRSEISHAKNDRDYTEKRERERQHLKRSRQYLAIGEMQKALDECELVLVGSPYNQEALRLRSSIQRKRKTIRDQEFKATREGMIADVGNAWAPPYAINAREVDEKPNAATVKSQVGDDPERSKEQSIIKRMKEMRLPSISFKPPATIIDAIDYFRTASRDFDRPEIPIEQRGFNFVLKTPEAIQTSAAAEEDEGGDDFSEDAESDTPAAGGVAGVPVIPMITASDITFYEALKLVCESVDYKFVVQGPIVMVMHKDISTDELVTRSFPVLATFLEKMGSASGDIKEMKSNSSFGGKHSRNDEEDEGQERDWKQFFELMGVKWPEGSTIFYVKTIGRLFVKNTIDNLAEFETVLMSLNQQIKLVEIETRFVEVCQEDLNSLGFEWILNSDYTLGTSGGSIGKALGLKQAAYNNGYTETKNTVKVTDDGGVTYKDATEITRTASDTTSWSKYDMNGNRTKSGIIGVDKTSGDTYTTGMRYLSTVGNHISGGTASANDQFMKVNAFIGSADLSMILHMLSQRSDTDLLSAPKVLTRPGEEAVMKVVTEYIYPTDYDVQIQSSSSSSSSSGSSGSSSILAIVEPQSFTMREVGVILQVTPTLTDDGNVVDLELNTQVVDEPTWKNYGMKLPYSGNTSLQNFEGLGEIFTGVAEVLEVLGTELSAAAKKTYSEMILSSATDAMSELSGTDDRNITYYDAPMEQPFFHVRSIDSKVSVYPGATIVMGGLITETRKAMDDKIPFLGDIPFIGRLFRSHSEETSKRNLLIFVTTRIVDGRGRELADSGFKSPDEAVPAAAAPAK